MQSNTTMTVLALVPLLIETKAVDPSFLFKSINSRSSFHLKRSANFQNNRTKDLKAHLAVILPPRTS